MNHYVKSVQIRIYFWSLFSCIQSEYRKIRTRNNSVFRHFWYCDKWKNKNQFIPHGQKYIRIVMSVKSSIFKKKIISFRQDKQMLRVLKGWHWQVKTVIVQPSFTCSKSTMETPEQCVNSV